MAFILTRVEERIGYLTFDHERKLNVLSEALVDETVSALEDFARQDVRAVILRAGPSVRVWSAGHDISEMPEPGRDPLSWEAPVRKLVRAIEACPAPVIAMIQGSVWGGACETALACDLVLVAPDVTFAFTPAKLGMPYNMSGMTTIMNAANLRAIKEMAFTAEPVDAQQAQRLGMVNHVVPADELEERTVRLARRIAENAPMSISLMKEELRLLTSANPLSSLEFERVQGRRRLVYDSADYQEGLRAFREKRAPDFKGE